MIARTNEERRAAKERRQRERPFHETPLMRLGTLVGPYGTSGWWHVDRDLLYDALVHIDARMQSLPVNARGRSSLRWLERWQLRINGELSRRDRSQDR